MKQNKFNSKYIHKITKLKKSDLKQHYTIQIIPQQLPKETQIQEALKLQWQTAGYLQQNLTSFPSLLTN